MFFDIVEKIKKAYGIDHYRVFVSEGSRKTVQYTDVRVHDSPEKCCPYDIYNFDVWYFLKPRATTLAVSLLSRCREE